jgi:aryl-alcohol dehydrogenase-like predicted oxidoreductase
MSTRRHFLQTAAVTTLSSNLMASTRDQTASISIPKRPLGRSGLNVSILGVGGFHVGSADTLDEATSIVQQALDAGLNFFDNAWEYHDGKSEEWLGHALGSRRDEAVLMTKVCTHGRDKKVAMQMLEQSLRRLRTDHLDVWQIHEVIYDNDPDLIFRTGGAAEALLEAKQQGKVRLIGFTGHKDPSIHLKMLSHGFPFDTVQMPLNPFDATFRSFQHIVLPEAQKQGIAVLGMKSLGGSGEMVTHGAITVKEALTYAMSLPVATTISGMNTLEILKQNLEIVSQFEKLSPSQMAAIEKRCQQEAGDGHLELFKTTVKYDGKIGRQQHEYPDAEKLPV